MSFSKRIGDRNSPAGAEGLTSHTESGRGLFAFVFVSVDLSNNLPNHLFFKTGGNNLMNSLIFLHVAPKHFIQYLKGRQIVLGLLTWRELRRGRFKEEL